MGWGAMSSFFVSFFELFCGMWPHGAVVWLLHCGCVVWFLQLMDGLIVAWRDKKMSAAVQRLSQHLPIYSSFNLAAFSYPVFPCISVPLLPNLQGYFHFFVRFTIPLSNIAIKNWLIICCTCLQFYVHRITLHFSFIIFFIEDFVISFLDGKRGSSLNLNAAFTSLSTIFCSISHE